MLQHFGHGAQAAALLGVQRGPRRDVHDVEAVGGHHGRVHEAVVEQVPHDLGHRTAGAQQGRLLRPRTAWWEPPGGDSSTGRSPQLAFPCSSRKTFRLKHIFFFKSRGKWQATRVSERDPGSPGHAGSHPTKQHRSPPCRPPPPRLWGTSQPRMSSGFWPRSACRSWREGRERSVSTHHPSAPSPALLPAQMSLKAFILGLPQSSASSSQAPNTDSKALKLRGKRAPTQQDVSGRARTDYFGISPCWQLNNGTSSPPTAQAPFLGPC